MEFVFGGDYHFQFTTNTLHKVTIVKDSKGKYQRKKSTASGKQNQDDILEFHIYNHITKDRGWCNASLLFPLLTDTGIVEIDSENNNHPGVNGKKMIATLRKQKVIAKQKIKESGIQKNRRKSTNMEKKSADNELVSKYDKIDFQQSDFDTYSDFHRIIKNSYLETLPCIVQHDSCVNKYNNREALWCANVECKGLTQYTIKNRIQKFWRMYEAGQRLEKPYIFIGWKSSTNANKKKTVEHNNTKIIPFKKHNIHWCYVCGKKDTLTKCNSCTASYHRICPSPKNSLNENCPQCKNGNMISTDGIVWHKLANYPWWPAQLINLKMRPDCLTKPPSIYHYSLQYFGENNYAFADIRELCQFSIDHNPELYGCRDKKLLAAYQSACESFICYHL